MTAQSDTIREAVGVFHDADDFQAAIDTLLSSGFDRAELSLLAADKAVEEKLGHVYDKVADLEDEPDTARTAYVAAESVGDAEGALIGGLGYIGAVSVAGAMVASGGALAGAAVAAALAGGAGAVIGSILADILEKNYADRLKHQIDRGGLLLWVRTTTPAREAKATEILRRHRGADVHVHDIPA